MATSFIDQLRSIAKELTPFTSTSLPGSRHWNETSYVQGSAKPFDAHALMWWSLLNNIADLLEAREAPVSSRQHDYLRRLLFGGMGSLTDFTLTKEVIGDEAPEINRRLQEKTTKLFHLLERLRPS